MIHTSSVRIIVQLLMVILAFGSQTPWSALAAATATHGVKTCVCCSGPTCGCHVGHNGVKPCTVVQDKAFAKLLANRLAISSSLVGALNPSIKPFYPDLVLRLRLCEATEASPPDRCSQSTLCLWLL